MVVDHRARFYSFCENYDRDRSVWLYEIGRLVWEQTKLVERKYFCSILPCPNCSSWLPNQMISLVLIFGFICRSSIFRYPEDLRNIVQQCAPIVPPPLCAPCFSEKVEKKGASARGSACWSGLLKITCLTLMWPEPLQIDADVREQPLEQSSFNMITDKGYQIDTDLLIQVCRHKQSIYWRTQLENLIYIEQR